MAAITIAYPWLTVQRHLKGKHNQKEHGRRGGAEAGGRQLELFDRDQYISQEWRDARAAEKQAAKEAKKEKIRAAEEAEKKKEWADKEKEKWLQVGVDLDYMDPDEIETWVSDVEYGWESQTGGYVDFATFIDDTFNYHDPDSGLFTQVNNVDTMDGIYVQITGNVMDRRGNHVGTFERNIQDGRVDHSYFELYPEAQGQGFGAKYYKHLEESYYNAGLAEVTIHANIDVGGYAWAKMGYDFQSDRDRRDFQRQLRTAFDDAYGGRAETPGGESKWDRWVEENGEPHHSWEIAAFTGPDGRRLGKEIMLGSDWYAYKTLYEDDPTWQAGQEYYESKGL